MTTAAPEAAPPIQNNAQITDQNASEAFSSMFANSPETKADYERVQKAKEKKTPVVEKKVETKEPEVKEEVKEGIIVDNKPEESPEVEGSEAAPKETKEQLRWSELKTIERKVVPELKSQIEAYKKQVSELEAKATLVGEREAEVERYKKDLEEAYGELRVSRVEATPEFKEHVTNARTQVFEEMVSIADRAKVDANALGIALHKDMIGESEALEAFMDENNISERNRTKIYTLSDNLVQIQKRESDLRANSKDVLQTTTKKQQEALEQRQQQITQERQKAADTVAGKFKDTLSSILPENHGLDFDSIKSDAQKFDSLQEGEKVYASYAGYALPKLMETYKAEKEKLTAELKSAKSELAKLRNGGPKATNGTSVQTTNGTKEPAKREELAKAGYDGFAKESMDRLFGR